VCTSLRIAVFAFIVKRFRVFVHRFADVMLHLPVGGFDADALAVAGWSHLVGLTDRSHQQDKGCSGSPPAYGDFKFQSKFWQHTFNGKATADFTESKPHNSSPSPVFTPAVPEARVYNKWAFSSSW
jgi:hypothetical protein